MGLLDSVDIAFEDFCMDHDATDRKAWGKELQKRKNCRDSFRGGYSQGMMATKDDPSSELIDLKVPVDSAFKNWCIEYFQLLYPKVAVDAPGWGVVDQLQASKELREFFRAGYTKGHINRERCQEIESLAGELGMA